LIVKKPKKGMKADDFDPQEVDGKVEWSITWETVKRKMPVK
jgi:hypothetical protein